MLTLDIRQRSASLGWKTEGNLASRDLCMLRDERVRTDDAILTLVTCYPFSYVGAAPERFVVRAALEPVQIARAP